MVARIWRTLLLLALAQWIGGLTFYGLVVVPIGTRHFGSVAQGFVTREVAPWLYALAASLVPLLAAEAWRRSSRLLAACVALFAAALLVAIILHGQLEGMLNLADRSVIDHERFYALHGVYLMVTAAQWLAGIAGFVVIACGESHRDLPTND